MPEVTERVRRQIDIGINSEVTMLCYLTWSGFEHGLKAFSALVTLWGVGFAVLKYRDARIQQRAQYIIDTFTAYRKSPEMLDAFYQLQFSSCNFFAEGKVTDHGMERKVDLLLDNFSRVVALHAMKAISERDLQHFDQELYLIYLNTKGGPLAEYFKYLDGLRNNRKISEQATFKKLRDLAICRSKAANAKSEATNAKLTRT